MPITNSRAQGQYYEDKACDFLSQAGLRLVCRNYTTRQGEVDLIMRQADTLVFVEVKYRQQSQFGQAVETVTYRKQQRILAAAKHYLMTQNTQAYCRFDVIAYQADADSPLWVKNAFQEY
ncbi:YraN family protein [Motilimonas pumila]|uniref:UPF0102 protein D1Z90_05110 n=1 Tax=Motilimonas pumila TaxID=2303987 RepID=A0A418YI47_9GAMM|nr:YraN family protein [Motilimonas pumila]RJG50025.1 YraN family protein [Motilimonas pumila]